MPKTLNSLMKHLRESGIRIGGSAQKRRLKNIGYYHGYKGYRFAKKAENRLPLTEFNQIAALYDFDMQIKTLFYPRVMAIETALKNYTLEAVIEDSKSSSFEEIWKTSLTGYRSYSGSKYRKAWERRQRLRGEIDGIIYGHRSRDVIGHFRDADKDVPIWALFEVMTLGNFGAFYECLSKQVKSGIAKDLGMPTNLESELILKEIIFALKDLRNATAHNSTVLDVRFQTCAVGNGIAQLLKQETGVGKIDFTDITDYVVLVTYLMSCMGISKTECKRFVGDYEAITERYRAALPFNIYSRIIQTTAKAKLTALRRFIGNR